MQMSFFAGIDSRLSDRHPGVGFDQLLVVEPSPYPSWTFASSTPTAVKSLQCVSNGARCFARFVRLKGLTNKFRHSASTAGTWPDGIERHGRW